MLKHLNVFRENLKKIIRRERSRDLPANPTSLAHLGTIPDKYQKTEVGDKFLLYDNIEDDDSGETEDRVIVFGTLRNISLLSKCKTWYLGGTFKTAPNIFTQIFVIMGAVTRPAPGVDEEPLTIAVPLVYSLLSSKTTESYEAVLRAVKDEARRQGVANVTPETVMTDFELAIKNATEVVFSSSSVKCCFFHLGQSLYRYAKCE